MFDDLQNRREFNGKPRYPMSCSVVALVTAGVFLLLFILTFWRY